MVPPYALSRAVLILLTIGLAVVRHRSPLELWNVLDTRWYAGIAAHGYAWSLDGKPALAFFPLYPALIHIGIRMGYQAVLVGLVIANGAALAALFYARALVADQWGPSTARRSVWLLTLFPTAFFTFAPYTESLFLFGAAAALYHSQRGQSAVAGLWFAVAVLTRSMGVILLAPMVMSVLWGRRRSLVAAFAPVVCAVAAYISFLVWERLPVTQLIGSEQHWHRDLTYPWHGFTASFDFLVSRGNYNAGWTAENLLQLGVAVVGLGLTCAAWRYLTPSAAVYCAGFWVVVLCTPEWRDGYFAPFSSLDRFVLALFPLAGWAATRLASRPFTIWLWVSGALMTGAAAVHLSGGWVG